jgi:hypothetical protein
MAANWTFVAIPVTGYPSGSNPLQVDNLGHLHLLTSFDQVLTYSTCGLVDCTSAAAWISVPVQPAGDSPVSASMVVDGSGQIHLSYSNLDGSLSYGLCTGACSSADQWAAIRLDRGGSPGSAIAVSSSGQATILSPVSETGDLRYLACMGSCLDKDNWEIATVERPDIFQSPPPGPPRLATGSDGSVRMAYTSNAVDLHYLE